MANSPIVYMTRVETFSASHRLNSIVLTVEENEALYQKCNNPNGHGHNYRLEVTLKGPVCSSTGMLMDMSLLKFLLESRVLSLLDHKNIDLDVDYFRDSMIVSTTENLAVFIWKQLISCKELEDKLFEVKIHETDKNVFVFRGEFV